jgi:hypothetical protein
MIKIVKTLRNRLKSFPCLRLPNPEAFFIVEIDAFDIDYDGILKQNFQSQEHIVRYHLRIWLVLEKIIYLSKKKILLIILCI